MAFTESVITVQKQIDDLLTGPSKSIIIGGGASNEKIQQLENYLNVSFPESYLWFLRKYGSIIAYGVEIEGVQRLGEAKDWHIAWLTLRERQAGLPNKYVIIDREDDTIYGIEAGNYELDSKVFSWSRQRNVQREESSSLYTFLSNTLEEAKSEWEE